MLNFFVSVGDYGYLELEDVSLLERCPHFRGCVYSAPPRTVFAQERNCFASSVAIYISQLQVEYIDYVLQPL